MISRLTVQMAMILLMTTIVFIAGYNFYRITLTPSGYGLGFVTAMAGGAVYLGLGQMIVGLIRNAESVNSTSRLVYFLFIMVGMFGELGVLGDAMGEFIKWTPYGSVKRLVAAGMQPSGWNAQTAVTLLVALGYGGIFSLLGIRWFRWDAR
jgi:ABC-2 type transport system permease protein